MEKMKSHFHAKTFYIFFTDFVFYEGTGPVVLPCFVTPNAELRTLFWTRKLNLNTFPLPSHTIGGSITSPDLEFAEVKWFDDGQYTCHTYYTGEGWKNYTVEVTVIRSKNWFYYKYLCFWSITFQNIIIHFSLLSSVWKFQII